MALEIIVLAAGMGKRMHSDLPKVLHPVANEPMLFHVLRTANSLNPVKIHVVLGHQSQKVAAAIEELPEDLRQKLVLSIQSEQLGTAHAVMQVSKEMRQQLHFILIQLPENLDKNYAAASGNTKKQLRRWMTWTNNWLSRI